MEIKIVKAEKREGLFTCYYPKYFAEWIVEFRTVFGTRKEKVLTIGDGVTNQQAIIDKSPIYESREIDKDSLIDFKINEMDFKENGHLTLKKHFVYYRRSFKVPKIDWISTIPIYVPYQIENRKRLLRRRKKTFLYEPISKHYDKLDNYSIIQQFYKERIDLN